MKLRVLAELLDMETAKVLAAGGTPFVVWCSNIELGLKVAAALGACIYVWIKVFRLARKNRSQRFSYEE